MWAVAFEAAVLVLLVAPGWAGAVAGYGEAGVGPHGVALAPLARRVLLFGITHLAGRREGSQR